MIYESIASRKEKIALVGLGYVGMPIAVAFAKKVDVIGFDLNSKKIELYKRGIDPTKEVGDKEIAESSVYFTDNEKDLQNAMFYIVAVPTPINQDKTPDLSPVVGASRIVGRNLQKGAIVVYESTVYPGVTEDICIPILERESGLKCGADFKVGYSPERINPGDKVHRLNNIKKIVSGMDEESLEDIAKVYEMVIDAGVYRASSIKVAEAAKVVENSQRDINIAFMNELAMVFERMGIDTNEVVDAMNTKWNALGFRPGLVGGHCIGVDPYYFVYQAENLGYHSQIVAAGRKVNDGMGEFVANAIIKELVWAGKVVKGSRVAMMGLTFKEDCPDIRNTKVVDIIEKMEEYGIEVMVIDPYADADEVMHEYGYELHEIQEAENMDAIVFAVAHRQFKELSVKQIAAMCKVDGKIVFDIKGIFDKKELIKEGMKCWRL